jgi:hypothetical protein
VLFNGNKYPVNQTQPRLDQLYETFGQDFCLCPFLGAFYQTNGGQHNSVRPCSLVPDHDDYAVHHSIGSTRNNQHWRNIRQHYLQGTGSQVADCQVCHETQKQGGVPARLGANRHFAEHTTVDLVAAIQEIESHDLVSDQVPVLDYYPSNYCNYSCIMCSGGASSSRRTFEIRLHRSSESVPIRPADLDFQHLLDTAEIVNFTGGETVMQPQVHSAIDHLIQTGRASQVTVFILTNASSYDPAFVTRLAQFRNVIFMCSIDGVGPVLEYQRRGAVWSRVESNILKYLHTPGLSLVMNSVLTAANLLDMHELVAWAIQHQLPQGMLAVTPVFGVSALSVAAVPEPLRQLARDRLEPFMHNSIAANIISILDHTVHDPLLVDQFVEHIYHEDSASHQQFVSIVPEWKPYFDNSAFRPPAV